MEVPATKEITMLGRRTRLALSRTEDQELHIGDVIITFKKVQGKTVSVVVEAPENVVIIRPDAKDKTPKPSDV
jgi:sRNA-binding carbon storage regulator CsrA